jgi:hypothetical protein
LSVKLRRAFLLAALAATPALVLAHVRLHNPANGNVLFWSNPGSVGIVIQEAGSDDLASNEHVPALRMAIDEWNDATDTTAQLVENTSTAARARTDWESSSVHLILFDETNASGYFPQGTGTVAITPVSFFGDGRIADADVLFNGDGFSFTTSGEPGAFDVQDVATHELGHLLGLDHSGVVGSTMYPYVSPSVTLHRSLARDDSGGIAAANPTGARGGLTGTVRRSSDNSGVGGAYVVARDDAGRTAGSSIADASGVFLLRGLLPGDYALFAIPLDSPVSGGNLTPGHVIATDFQPLLGASATVAAGGITSYGTLLVGGDSNLTLGRNFDEFPLRAIAGQTTMHTLHGGGMGALCTLSAGDPTVTVSPVSWIGSTQVTFTVTVPPGAAPGHTDLVLQNTATSILAGALEITPESPQVASVVPGAGSKLGGDALTITGSGFAAGARVAIGDTLYEDGSGGCAVVDDSTITLTTLAPVVPGTYDVVVIDDSGVEGRASGAYTFLSAPEIDVVFPSAGSTAGGTQVTVTGNGFVEPMLVRVDGVLQTSVVVESVATLRFTTEASLPGASVVEIEDSDGDVASAAFTFVAQPDPAPDALSPASGGSGGGTLVTITGSGFHAGHSVVFGADPNTGVGGVVAASVTLVDASTLTARSPSHAAGAVSVFVTDTGTGQSAAAPDEFTYRDEGGGGGGCSLGLDPRDDSWRAVLSGIAWLPFVAIALALQRRRARSAWARAA